MNQKKLEKDRKKTVRFLSYYRDYVEKNEPYATTTIADIEELISIISIPLEELFNQNIEKESSCH